MDAKLRFENFIQDQNNSEAYTVAQKAAKGSLCGIPVVIHSEAGGQGKTHLIHAIGNEALRCDRKVRVALFSVEWFSRTFISALRDGMAETLRAKIRVNYDICLVDELTFIDGKQQIQRELFQALKEHSEHGCRIVLASALPLDAMKDWHDEFKTWLLSGINVGIAAPGAEARLAFLKVYLTENGMSAYDGLANCLHLTAGPTFRELQAAVIRLQAAALLESVEPTAEYAWKLFKHGD